MPDILNSGQWERVALPDTGAIRLSLVSRRSPARLEIRDAATAPKYLGADRTAAAFPARSVSPDRPVSVRATTATGEAFSGDERVDLGVVVGVAGQEQSFLLRGLDVAGQADAALIRLERAEGGVLMRPGEGGAATLGLGGWCARRRQESGEPCAPAVRRLVVDTSASMRAHAGRVRALERFLSDMAATTGTDAPRIERPPAGGAPRNGVGAADVPDPRADGTILLTDVPPAPGGARCLLIGPAALARALPSPGSFVADDEVWAELERTDRAFSASTLATLTPLLDWLTAGEKGDPR